MGIPSITYSGSVLPLIVVAPRIRTDSQPLGVRVMVTPGTRAWRTFSMGWDGFWARSSAVTTVPLAGRVGSGSGMSFTGGRTWPRQPEVRPPIKAQQTARRGGNDAI